MNKKKITLSAMALLGILQICLGTYWSLEPELPIIPQTQVVGEASTRTLISLVEILLQKNGGYISNDKLPPGLLLDNMKNFEFGLLVQLRDFSRVLREDFSRSQGQSMENKNLAKANPFLNFNNNSWVFPSSEGEYKKSLPLLQNYIEQLSKEDSPTQFFARADNLSTWLEVVQKRLGSLSQRLSASVGTLRVNTDLMGDSSNTQSTKSPNSYLIKTPWHEVDDIFYEARGSCFALIALFRAIQKDFNEILKKKNALVGISQITQELEETQAIIYSPIILNGNGLGIFANHSLVMANYISRANAIIIELRRLLERG